MVASAMPPSSSPGPIEPSATFRFAAPDGSDLYGEYFAPASPRGQVLILHGYAEHCGRYRELAHVLVQAGFATLAFDQRGHGRSHGARGHVLRFDEYLADVEAALAELDRRAGGELPLALVCHSHGGLIGMRLLADPWRLPRRLRCAVLSSPFLRLRLKVSPVKRTAARWIGWLVPSFSMPNEIRIETLTHDDGKLAERRVDTLCHDVAGARWYNEALAAQQWVHEFAPRVTTPTLWLVAGEDALADPLATREVFDRLGTPGVWHRYDSLYHELFNETERGAIFATVRAYLDENFP
jgi:alpha-beta hydrolase superfamily lysophospholipase